MLDKLNVPLYHRFETQVVLNVNYIIIKIN